MKVNWTGTLASLLLLLQGAVVAEGLPPEVPNGIGPIDEVRDNVIIVGDLPYLMQGVVLVTDKTGGMLPMTALQPNRQVMVFSETNPEPGQPPLARRIVVTGE
jgi:hypothetical protein